MTTNNVISIIFGLFAASVIAIGYCFYQEFKKPDFSLKKDEWHCTNYHDYTTLQPVIVGKTTILQPYTHHDCVQWTRNDY